MPLVPSAGLRHVKRRLLQRRRARAQELQRRRFIRPWGEMLEPRLMMAVDTPDIVVGRTLSAYSIADVQNNALKITYTVYNQEAEDVSGVLLTSTLQSGVSLVDATQLPDQNGQELAWSLGTIPAYGRTSVELTVELANNTILTIDDGAEAFSTLNARASTDAAPPAVLKANPLPAALLASTADANTTDPFIQEQAARLDYDPQNIIDFLQDEIGFESYTGSLRGARGTLWSSAGNALDEASLGVALFRASGIPAQYAAGTLSDPLAKQLILSMFAENFQVVGYIPPGTQLADPQNDPTLLAETRQHYWLQFDTGGGLQNLDTTFASSTIGETFATASSTFSEVPASLRHKVNVRLTAELYYPGFASLIGALNQLSGATGIPGTSRLVVLDVAFEAVNLVGRPITVGNYISLDSPAAAFSPTINTYTPYVELGDAAQPLPIQDLIITGTPFQEIHTGLPIGQQLLTGLFLNLSLTSPAAGNSDEYEHVLLDKIGFAARQGLTGSTNLLVEENGQPATSTFDLTTISFSPSFATPAELGAQLNVLRRLEADRMQIVNRIGSGLRSAETSVLERDLAVLARDSVVASQRAQLAATTSLSDALSKQLSAVSNVKAYFSSPRITIAASQVVTDQIQSTTTFLRRIDMRKDDIRVVLPPGQGQEAILGFNVARGFANNSAETEALALIGTQSSAAPVNSTRIFAAAEEQGVPIVAVREHQRVDDLNLSLEAKARISAAIAGGLLVFAPSRPVVIDSRALIGWFEFNPRTGETIGVLENGEHGAVAPVPGGPTGEASALQTLSQLLTRQLFKDGAFMSGYLLGFTTILFIRTNPWFFGSGNPLPSVDSTATKLSAQTFERTGVLARMVQYAELSLFEAYVERPFNFLPDSPASMYLRARAGFNLAIALGLRAIAADPPVPIGIVGGSIAPSNGNTDRFLSLQLANRSTGSVTGLLASESTMISGQLSASWVSNSTNVLPVNTVEAGGAQVFRDGVLVASGTIAIVSSQTLNVSIAGPRQISTSGRGSLWVYGAADGQFEASADWQHFSAEVTGNVSLAVTTDLLSVNDVLLPAGTYTIRLPTVRLAGEALSSGPETFETAQIIVDNGTIQFGPSSGTAQVNGIPIVVDGGFTVETFTGSLNLTSNVNLHRVLLNGATEHYLRATAVAVLPADQNTPAEFRIDLETSFSDDYSITATAPEAWTVDFHEDGTLFVTPRAGVQSGPHPVRVVVQSRSKPELLTATDLLVVTSPTVPGMGLSVVVDPVFTVPFSGAQVPTSFQALMMNLGPAPDIYEIAFPNPPAGFNILRSANSLTVPAGETGITGIYLEPNGVLPAPGTSISFTVTATSQTDPLITQTETFTFQMPAVAAVTVEGDPAAVSTIPGAPVTADVTIKNVGNVPYNLAIGASLPNGLALSGLTTPVVLAVGQSTTQTVTLTPAAGTPLNTTLTPTFTYGPAAAANQATVVQIDTADAFAEVGQAVSISADVFAGVLQAQQGSIVYVVKNALGAVVHTSAAIPLALGVVASTQKVNLGTISTTGFANGEYTIEATVRDASNQPLAGALGVGKFVVGLPISAEQDVRPNRVLEGLELTYVTNNATVESSVTVSLQPLVSIIDTNGSALNIALQGNLAYVAGTKEVTIVDLANPASPQVLGSFGAAQLSQDALNVAQLVGGNLVIGSQSTVNANNSNIIIYSLANPLSPQLVSNTAVPYRFITDLLVQGNTAIIPTSGVNFTLPGTIIGQFGDIITVNLSDPVSPTLADVLFDTNGSPNGGPTRQSGGTIVNSSLAYIGSSTFTGNNTTTGSGRVLIVNIADPSNITVAGELQIPGVKQVLDIAIDGNRALVVGSSGGLRNPFNGFGDLGLDGTLTLTVLDITNLNSPTILGTTEITAAEFGSGTAPGLLQAVSLGGQKFAVSGVQVPQHGPVLVVVDATNPADIQALNLSVSAPVNGLSVSGNFLHASSAVGLATYRIDALTEKSVQVAVQVPTGTGVDVVDDSFSIAPSQVIVGAGFDTLVWNLTLGADNLEQKITWNSDLTGLTPGTLRAVSLGATIDYGGTSADLSLPAQIVAATPPTQTLQLPVRVVVPGADAIASASVTAAQAGYPDLGNRLSDLATALTNLVQNPTSAVFHSQAVASLDSVIPLVANDPFSGGLVAALEANRTTLAAATTPADIQTAVQGLGSSLDSLSDVLQAELAHGFTFTLGPNSAIALPGAPTQFGLGLENTGTQTTTYQLGVMGLPPNVTSAFMQNGQSITTFTLEPGQADNGTVHGGIEPITLLLTVTGNSLFPAGFTVTVTAVAAPQITLSQTGALAVRDELIDVITVSSNPAFTEPGPTVNISARILSAVNSPQQALAFFTITDPLSTVIFTSAPVTFPLSVPSSLNTIALGGFNTTGLAQGNYRIDVTLSDLANQPIPGATGQGSLQVGTPVGATLTVTPEQAPPGTSTVLNTLEVTRGVAIPDTLTLFGQVQTTPSATTVALYQNGAQRLAYVGGTNGVDIVDVTDPASPVMLSTFADNLIVQGGFTGVRIHRIGNVDYLIVGTQVTSNGNRFTLLLYSLANPTSPVLTNTPTGTPISHVFASDFLPSGNTIIVPTAGASGFFPRPITTQFGNVLSIDISNPAAPVLTDVFYNSPGPPNSGTSRQSGGAIIDSQIAYITSSTSSGGNLAAGVGRIFVMDYSNPTNLQLLRELQIPGTHHALTLGVQGNRAVVVSSTGGLVDFVSPLAGNLAISVLDITDHANPVILGSSLVVSGTSFPPPSAGVAKISVLPLSNGLFAVSEILMDGSPVLLLVDPSNPSNIIVTQTPTPNLLNEMAVSGNLLYATSSAGVTIYEVFGSITVSASVQVPSGTGVTIVPGSFSTPPTQTIPGPAFDTLVWQLSASASEPTVITWQSTVANLQMDERRPVTLGGTVDFTSQGTPGQLQIPETAVIGQHLITVTPEGQAARPGETASYVVTVRNPTNVPVSYELSLAGVPAAWANLPSSVLVPAQGFVNVPLTLTSSTFAALSEYGFAVTASLAGTARDAAPARLILSGAPVLDPDSHGVVATLNQSAATAGQGVPATFTVRVINTGSATDTFNLAATVPPGFAVAFEQASVSVPPGASNFREVQLVVTPPPGTAAGDFPITVIATSATQAGLTDQATGILTVLRVGVVAEIDPSSANPESTFELTITNTGETTDTFDLSLGGPAALSAALSEAVVTLDAGATQVVNIDVAAIDFAVPGALELFGIATSRTHAAIRDADRATITIAATQGITARFEDDSVELTQPGPATLLLLVDNIGNIEDGFMATIEETTGPLTASLIGLDGQPAQTVPVFRVPGLGTGAIEVQANLQASGMGGLRVRITSLTDPSITTTATAVVMTQVTSGLRMSCAPMHVGLNTCTVLGATPGGVVNLAQGIEPGELFLPRFGVTLGINDPKIVAQGIVQPDGRAVVQVFIPSQEMLERLIFQAFEHAPIPRTTNIVIVGTPLIAAAGQGPGAAAISANELDAVRDEAIARWEATGLSLFQSILLRSIRLELADLDSGILGRTVDGAILIDATAAGHGWFLDATPSGDTEFNLFTSLLERVATTGGAVGQIDLLTALMHEFGHVLGHSDLSDSQVHELMAAVLPVSTRRSPVAITPRAFRAVDVNRDGFVSPFDALLVVNYLNTSASLVDVVGPIHRDVNLDGFVSPIDALRVITFLHSQSLDLPGEGESSEDTLANFNQAEDRQHALSESTGAEMSVLASLALCEPWGVASVAKPSRLGSDSLPLPRRNESLRLPVLDSKRQPAQHTPGSLLADSSIGVLSDEVLHEIAESQGLIQAFDEFFRELSQQAG